MYLDSNVFIYAALDVGDLGEAARALLKKIQENKATGIVSPLVFDEVLWVIQKMAGREDAKAIAQGLLELPLQWVDVGYTSVRQSMPAYESGLDPRDAMHVGIMIDYSIKVIVSEDKDFDKVKTIERKNIKTILKELDTVSTGQNNRSK
jgi:hypothetical protein